MTGLRRTAVVACILMAGVACSDGTGANEVLPKEKPRSSGVASDSTGRGGWAGSGHLDVAPATDSTGKSIDERGGGWAGSGH